MTSSPGLFRPFHALAACGLLVVAAAGCHDATDDPFAVVITEETQPALDLRAGLPALPDLVARAKLEGSVTRAVDLWMGSWAGDTAEGRALRAEAYDQTAGPLSAVLGADGVEALMAEVGGALRAVAALEADRLPEELAMDYDRISGLHREAVAALEAGVTSRALARTMESADALREIGPRSVATALVARAEARLKVSRQGEDVAGTADVDRADRLVRGARMALEDEDWSRAVQRAYYACQLLGVDLR